MAEETKEKNSKSPLLDSFMKAGKISVFESGLDRPDHLQERPFANLLPKGKVSFIKMSETADKLYVKTADEMAEDHSLDTEAHKFFQNIEKRFRTVMPGVTIFVIDPDAVQGRYLMDHEADRSLGKSLYMYVEDKLQKASAGNNQTFLTQQEILKSVADSGITDRNPFSMRAAVAPSDKNLAGLGNVNLVIGDNPDAMEAIIFGDTVIGAEQRRIKEGISREEFRRLTIYHELGHATDHNYASALNSVEKITETELDNVMCRHRTECIADAHGVLQLARDFGNTKCAELWGDCRIEYLRHCVDRALEDTKYDNDFIKKLREAEEKSHALNPSDPDYENNFKKLMADKNIANTIKKLGTPLAYHTTDVVDATVKWAKEHLADGSLQKMTDYEVIKQAQVMSETYGLTRQQMAEMSIALAKGEKHPKYEQMMQRVQESRDRMPIDNKELEKQYELRRELHAYQETAGLYAGLGLPIPDAATALSEDLIRKLAIDQKLGQQKKILEQLSVDKYQQNLLDKLEKTSSREEIRSILGKEKEALRGAGTKDAGKKDLFAGTKLKVVDSVIAEIPNVEAVMTANRVIKKQLGEIKSTTEVSGSEALVHFIKNELRETTSMSKTLAQAFSREPDKMTPAEQLSSMRSEYKEFKKALIAEKETQIAAFAIRSDKDMWGKISADPILSSLIDQKAKQKPDAVLAQYQMNMGSMNKEIAATLFQDINATHQYLVGSFTENACSADALKAKDARMFDTMKKYADSLKTTDSVSPLNLKNFKIAQKKTVLEQIVMNSKKQR